MNSDGQCTCQEFFCVVVTCLAILVRQFKSCVQQTVLPLSLPTDCLDWLCWLHTLQPAPFSYNNTFLTQVVFSFTHPPILSALLLILSASRFLTSDSPLLVPKSIYVFCPSTFPVLSDRNPLWTHSNVTPKYFFSQNCRPAMFSVPCCCLSINYLFAALFKLCKFSCVWSEYSPMCVCVCMWVAQRCEIWVLKLKFEYWFIRTFTLHCDVTNDKWECKEQNQPAMILQQNVWIKCVWMHVQLCWYFVHKCTHTHTKNCCFAIVEIMMVYEGW